MSLTDAQIRAFKAAPKRIRRSDGGGLYLDLMPSGRKVFRLAYRYNNQQRTLLVGDYPNTRLVDARLKAAKCKALLRSGIDPCPDPAEKTDSLSNAPNQNDNDLWGQIAQDYLKLRQQNGAAPRTMVKLDRQVGVTIKALGSRSVESITAQDVLRVVTQTRISCRKNFNQRHLTEAIKFNPNSITVYKGYWCTC